MATLTIELPPQQSQRSFNLRHWAELIEDSELAKIQGRIETDRHGHIIMRPPPAPSHGSFQSESADLLRTECILILPPERGHACPQRAPSAHRFTYVLKPFLPRTLLRTGMSALRTGGSIKMRPSEGNDGRGVGSLSQPGYWRSRK